jgi:hypothetical protein
MGHKEEQGRALPNLGMNGCGSRAVRDSYTSIHSFQKSAVLPYCRECAGTSVFNMNPLTVLAMYRGDDVVYLEDAQPLLDLLNNLLKG